MRKSIKIRKDKPIIEVDYGIASSYDDGIEVNWKLQGKLRDKVLAHENSHDNGKYTKKDFLTDFQSQNSHFLESFKFAIKNLEAMIGFFPLMYSYHFKSWTYNSSAIFPFLFFGLIFSTFWWFTVKISFLNSFICYCIVILLINVFLLIYTHRYWKMMGSGSKIRDIN